jgi:hypothetical protein
MANVGLIVILSAISMQLMSDIYFYFFSFKLALVGFQGTNKKQNENKPPKSLLTDETSWNCRLFMPRNDDQSHQNIE